MNNKQGAALMLHSFTVWDCSGSFCVEKHVCVFSQGTSISEDIQVEFRDSQLIVDVNVSVNFCLCMSVWEALPGSTPPLGQCQLGLAPAPHFTALKG